jgi:hypothetical protein
MDDELKKNFEWFPISNGPYWDQYPTGYKKGKSLEEIADAKKARWAEIRGTPEIGISSWLRFFYSRIF